MLVCEHNFLGFFLSVTENVIWIKLSELLMYIYMLYIHQLKHDQNKGWGAGVLYLSLESWYVAYDVATWWGKAKGKCLSSHQIIFYFMKGHIYKWCSCIEPNTVPSQCKSQHNTTLSATVTLMANDKERVFWFCNCIEWKEGCGVMVVMVVVVVRVKEMWVINRACWF